MTNETAKVLVVRDEAGEIYVLTDEMLAQARATDEQRATIEEPMGDVQGFFTPVPIPSAQPVRFDGGGGVGSTAQLSVARLTLAGSMVEARPAIGPRPGV
jgi:hypothetical protein